MSASDLRLAFTPYSWVESKEIHWFRANVHALHMRCRSTRFIFSSDFLLGRCGMAVKDYGCT